MLLNKRFNHRVLESPVIPVRWLTITSTWDRTKKIITLGHQIVYRRSRPSASGLDPEAVHSAHHERGYPGGYNHLVPDVHLNQLDCVLS